MTPFDPEFDAPIKVRKPGVRPRLDRRSVGLIALLTALWLGIAWCSGLLGMTLAAVGIMFSGVLIIGLALIPSALGFWLFAIGGRIVEFCRRKGRWPDENEARRKP